MTAIRTCSPPFQVSHSENLSHPTTARHIQITIYSSRRISPTSTSSWIYCNGSIQLRNSGRSVFSPCVDSEHWLVAKPFLNAQTCQQCSVAAGDHGHKLARTNGQSCRLPRPKWRKEASNLRLVSGTSGVQPLATTHICALSFHIPWRSAWLNQLAPDHGISPIATQISHWQRSEDCHH